MGQQHYTGISQTFRVCRTGGNMCFAEVFADITRVSHWWLRTFCGRFARFHRRFAGVSRAIHTVNLCHVSAVHRYIQHARLHSEHHRRALTAASHHIWVCRHQRSEALRRCHRLAAPRHVDQRGARRRTIELQLCDDLGTSAASSYR